jgi:hypothetical protein
MTYNRIEPSFLCELCSEHVELETANTDEKGKAVHEECYVSFIAAQYRNLEAASRSLLILSALPSLHTNGQQPYQKRTIREITSDR